ncbi:SDR family oxidoreductase [Paenibacillus aurantius]|uniref:SDR family oxidoreductase n=1 Tax=Paenibacillus aurantius TaxID=2918900 RepID=A0AA96RF10_9BACL|nr:SDR family oxidoreductase [Paenibacillus aurantius]WNQ13060.1 SDR family oxidoreductase [Paenibacillus aurantius]
MSSLEGKIILITGGLGTLGSSAIRLFLKQGATIAASDRKALQEHPAVEAAVEPYGKERFQYFQADVTDEAQVQELAEEIGRRFGALHGLYHNVYVNVAKPLLELTLEQWEDSMRGSLTSAFLVCKYMLPLMIRSGGGSIVNTSSIIGQVPLNNYLAYGTAKAGMNQFTRLVAKDYASQGIRANVLVPGDFKSDEFLESPPDSFREMMGNITLLGRSARADEINEVASFLLSDASSYVTASLYSADGGFRL